MSAARAMVQPSLDASVRKRNLRTGLVLAGIALAFFVGVFLNYLLLK